MPSMWSYELSSSLVTPCAHAEQNLTKQKEAFESNNPEPSPDLAELSRLWATGTLRCFEDHLRSGNVLDVVCRTRHEPEAENPDGRESA